MKILIIKKKITAYLHRDRSKLYITSHRDWTIILLVSFIAFVSVSVHGYYVYVDKFILGVKDVVVQEDVHTDSEIEIFKRELDKTLAYFENKKESHRDFLKDKRIFNSYLSTYEDIIENEEVATSSPEENIETEGVSLFDTFMRNVSDAASVWKAFFFDHGE